MPWYTAVLVRAEDSGEPLEKSRVGDFLYRLIEAADAEAAYSRALELGAAATEPFTDEDGVTTTFRFVGLAGLMELAGPPADGSEIYSQLIQGAPLRSIVRKDELAVFASLALQDDENDDTWADGEGPVRTGDEDETLAGGPPAAVDLEQFDGGSAPLKPR
ncbi:MAG TPA: DUF4288 domain-containing protein [Thermoanaerobaculia bacterium]|nr:DUF4288 domain-containing protein [Thermoanaerobaculia bacterium]